MKDLGPTPGSLRRLVAGLITGAVLVLAVGVGVGSGAGSDGLSGAQGEQTSVPAGFDLFETDPEQTVFRFRDQTTIPPNFFDEGSEAFQGDVSLGGVPIDRFRNQDTGDADTVVERKSAATVPADGSGSEPVQIELVRLSLASMAPIEVKVRDQTQGWDVQAEASLTRPSTGQMRIAGEGSRGGTFDSQLTVYPKFTFTRLSDGATRVLDVGALPDGQRPEVTFVAEKVPWRRGCARPALAIRQLSAFFCPGLTIALKKKLTIEQAALAKHGIWPVQPRLEHFNCYTVSLHTAFKKRFVRLKDQFGARTKVLVSAPEKMCNPVRKNNEAFLNKQDHLRCYTTAPSKDLNRLVVLRNQFHVFLGRVRESRRLCLPSSKRRLPGPVPPSIKFQTEHFECYRLTPVKFPFPYNNQFAARTVSLRDQFAQYNVQVASPNQLCAPVAKNGKAVNHTVRHLVCYRYKRSPVERTVRIRNQFGQESLRTRLPIELCLPSTKLPLS